MKKTANSPSRRQILAGLGALTTTAALSSCFKTETPTQHYDTIIIGAGLAGLNAARILESEGANILILEASNRTGGRLYTLDNVPHAPEAGGLQVGPMYARLRSTAMELGIELEEFPSSPPGMMISLDGQNTTLKNWATWDHNPLPDNLKKIPPFALLNSLLPRPNPLSDLDSWKEADAFQYDVPLSTYSKAFGEDETIEKMISVSLQGNSLDDISTLGELRKNRVNIFERSNGKSHRIKGGSSRLPEAMAKSLKSQVAHNKKVTKIGKSGTKTHISCRDGSEYTANHVICTVPFSVLKDISIEPGLPELQQQAVQEIPYLPVTAFFFTAKEAFWEQDNLPPTMWTDSILERIFPLATPTQPVGVFWGLINGTNAVAFDKFPKVEQEKLILNELASMRPSTQGKITLQKIHSWAQSPHNRGAWSYWKPGQISKFSQIYTQPHANIHFAGEHTSTFAAGMEGAFESGEKAAWAILET